MIKSCLPIFTALLIRGLHCRSDEAKTKRPSPSGSTPHDSGRQDRRVIGVLDERVQVGEQLFQLLNLLSAPAFGKCDVSHCLRHFRDGATGLFVVLHLTALVRTRRGDLGGQLFIQRLQPFGLLVTQDGTVQGGHLAARQGQGRRGVSLGDPLLEGDEAGNDFDALREELIEIERRLLLTNPGRGLADASVELRDPALELLADPEALGDGLGDEDAGGGGLGHGWPPMRDKIAAKPSRTETVVKENLFFQPFSRTCEGTQVSEKDWGRKICCYKFSTSHRKTGEH